MEAVNKNGMNGIVVVLGSATAESAKLYGMTLTEGDPTWAGVLAGVPLNLPVYHVTEEEIKKQVPSDVYDAEVGISEMVLDVEDIGQALREVRAETEKRMGQAQ